MSKYILKRIGFSIITLFTLTTLTFFMMHLLPGDPFTGDKAVPPATLEALNKQYGLDKPVPEQYLIYMKNALQGDLGMSMHYKKPVVDIIKEAFPYSFDLGLRALIFATVMGVFLGIISAIKRGTFWDTAAMTTAIIGVSIPSFIVGALLQYFLGVKLYQWTGQVIFPITGWTTEMHKLLPAFALSFGSLATISRLMRTSMLDVLNSDYIKTAKAKGLPQSKIITKHAIRNAIMPVITVLGPISATLLTGTFVVESIFGIPGLGGFFVKSINTNDYTLIAGATIFFGAFLILANLIVDILYGIIDPRVKLDK